MFGLSLPKLLFTAVVVAVIWYGFKLLQARIDRRDAPSARAPKRREESAAPEDEVQDLVRCAGCGAYVLPKSRCAGCGRQN